MDMIFPGHRGTSLEPEELTTPPPATKSPARHLVDLEPGDIEYAPPPAAAPACRHSNQLVDLAAGAWAESLDQPYAVVTSRERRGLLAVLDALDDAGRLREPTAPS